MSSKIGTALKENPRMPTYERDSVESEPEPVGSETKVLEPQTKPLEPEVKTPEPEKNPLIPDFSKLTFGQEVATKLPVDGKEKSIEIPPPEQFPEKVPGKSTPQVEQAWASMRKANKALFEQNAELNSKLKAASDRLKEFDGKTPMAADEFERLTNERETLSKELRLSKLEATPEYKAAVTRPLEQIEGEIRRFSNKYSLNEHQVRRALVEPDPDKQGELLAQVAETFNDRDKINLFKCADAASEVMRKRDVLQKDVKQALDYIEAKRTAEEEARTVSTKAEWSTSLDKAWDAVGESLYLARPVKGNDEWNNSLDESKQLVAKTNFMAMDTVDRAKVLVQAALLPRACMAIAQLWKMYSETANALKRYQGVTPGAGGGHSGVGSEPTTPAMSEELSFIDAVETRMKGRQ
jgi:hypothetical protein